MRKYLLLTGILSCLIACSGNKDALRKNELIASGVKLDRKNIIAWFPKDSLSEMEMSAITDTILIGIKATNEILGSLDWQLYKNKPVNFYFSTADFRVSYASKDGDVFIPYFRIKSNKNPWLHETLHILLRSKKGNWNHANIVNTYLNMPQWFIEGLPEYLAMKISYENNLYKADLFNSQGLMKVDSVCQVQLLQENGPYILEHIGTEGILTELSGSSRGDYSPTFYNCSCSFTKYLAETYGVSSLINAIGQYGEEIETIENSTNHSIEVLKNEWLEKIKYSPHDNSSFQL